MTSGGARNRSGPPPDPNSIRSRKKGLTFRHLPPGGYDGKPPRFPLPNKTTREQRVWRQVWQYPQAAVWAEQPRFLDDVALYVRVKVESEVHDASPSTRTVLFRLRDAIGLSAAGMKELGWLIGPDEEPVAGDAEPASAAEAARNRLKVV